MTPATVLLALVTLERLAELWLARQNTRVLLAHGALEFSPGHYPLIVLLHAFWLAGLWWWGWHQPLNMAWLAIFLLLQVLRVWVLTTLGPRWTTRIIVQPGLSLCHQWAVPVDIPPQLRGGGRRDCGITTLCEPTVVRARFFTGQRCCANNPHTR